LAVNRNKQGNFSRCRNERWSSRQLYRLRGRRSKSTSHSCRFSRGKGTVIEEQFGVSALEKGGKWERRSFQNSRGTQPDGKMDWEKTPRRVVIRGRTNQNFRKKGNRRISGTVLFNATMPFLKFEIEKKKKIVGGKEGSRSPSPKTLGNCFY